MLIVSEEAATAIKDLCDSPGAPDGAGLRIYARPISDNEATLELELAPEAAPGDQVMEESGATIYLEPHAAVYLNDKVLDAQTDDEQVRFMINEQEDASG
ncbi:MAG TPA: iron-sulfur cluster biosynthesis family protein [Actinomycetota bacterium]|jgi:iron-sulfur cluster assembly protein|nr:iron-sulfur cluster biosynthesis family protein [Actinomycetota bacterium]